MGTGQAVQEILCNMSSAATLALPNTPWELVCREGGGWTWVANLWAHTLGWYCLCLLGPSCTSAQASFSRSQQLTLLLSPTWKKLLICLKLALEQGQISQHIMGQNCWQTILTLSLVRSLYTRSAELKGQGLGLTFLLKSPWCFSWELRYQDHQSAPIRCWCQ